MGKKWVFYGLAALCLTAVLLIPFEREPAIQTAAWGLSFDTPGESPRGPEEASRLAELDAAFVGDGEQKVLYLTFDAGYENGNTEKILDILQAHQVPAAFFLVGNYMERNKDLVRRMVQEGHIVGNHTMHHPDMQKKEGEAFASELRELEELFRQITGKALPKYYRPPQGLYSRQNLAQAQSMGYKTVFWSLAYADWDNNNQPTEAYALSKLLPRLHNGAVILLHSTSATNARILDTFLTRCKAEGYRFATLDGLFV